jgi:hypothetical protein
LLQETAAFKRADEWGGGRYGVRSRIGGRHFRLSIAKKPIYGTRVLVGDSPLRSLVPYEVIAVTDATAALCSMRGQYCSS